MKLKKSGLLLIFLFIACNQNIFAQVEDVVSVKSEIFKWKDAFNQKDLHATLSVYADNFVGYYPGIPILDVAAMNEQYTKFFNNKYLKVTLNVEIIEVQTNGALGYAVVNLIWAFLPSVSNSPQYAYEKGIQIWEKQPDGKWQMTRSSIFPYSEKKNTK
jgi:uncharacterized protein (TIGR02246 family)